MLDYIISSHLISQNDGLCSEQRVREASPDTIKFKLVAARSLFVSSNLPGNLITTHRIMGDPAI